MTLALPFAAAPEGERLALRPYQQACLEAVRASYRAGLRRVVVSMATGLGKAVVAASLPDFLGAKRRVLVVAHREELLEQLACQFRRASPGRSVAIEQAERRAENADVVVASVATIGRTGSPRLAALAPDDFGIVMVDEAHHATAPSYRIILDHFGVFGEATNKLLVGFTATPRRGDHVSLGAVFEEIAFSFGIERGIEEGWLAPIAAWQVRGHAELDGVSTRLGDFAERELAAAVNTEKRNDVIVAGWHEYAAGRRTIAFCVDVQHARDLAAMFRATGVATEAVWGEMPRDERRAALARFSTGETQVATNVGVLVEGYDEPRVDCVLLARPTKSLLLLLQMIGRGTRRHPEKDNLLVLDIVDNTKRHKIVGVQDAFDLPRTLETRGQDVLRVAKKFRAVQRQMPWLDVEQVRTPEELEVAARRVDLFRWEPPPEVARFTELAWRGNADLGFRLDMPKFGAVLVRRSMLGDWEVALRTGGPATDEVVGRRPSEREAIVEADDLVRQRWPDAMPLLVHRAQWRREAATDKQLRLLSKLGQETPAGVTRGQASVMLSHLLAERDERAS